MLFCISFDVALFPLAVKGRELKVFGRSLVCSVSVCIFSYSMLPQISLHGLLGIEFSGYKFFFFIVKTVSVLIHFFCGKTEILWCPEESCIAGCVP